MSQYKATLLSFVLAFLLFSPVLFLLAYPAICIGMDKVISKNTTYGLSHTARTICDFAPILEDPFYRYLVLINEDLFWNYLDDIHSPGSKNTLRCR